MSAAAPVSSTAPARSWWFLVAALLALAQLPVGLLAPPGRPGPRAYPPLIARGGLDVYPVHEGFVANGVYPATTPDTAYPGIEKFGSWLGGDGSTGRLETPWFRPGNAFELLVAGYPSTHGNSLTLELRRPTDPPGIAAVRRPLELEDAHEHWVRHPVRLNDGEVAAGLTEARLVAVDAGTGTAGWLGVSAPFHEGRHTLLWSLGVLGRFALAVGAAVTALVGLGLALRWQLRTRRGREEPRWWTSLAFVPLPGAAWLVGTALLAWRLAPGVNPAWVAAVGLAPLFGLCVGVFARAPAGALASATEWRVLGVAGLVLTVAVTKASVSAGPAGELYGGTVSRTLEVGGRSDSRIAFHTVQLVAHGAPPFSPVGRGYFAPWGFSSRGPLLALASAPLVLASGAQVPVTMPDQPWLPFDPEGFTVYRLAMMALGAAALLPLFAAAGALLGGDRRGLLAVALAALTPFVVHEVWFTWGKLSTAGCLAAAVYCLASRRFVAAGTCVAIGYLCHPLTLLYLPFLGLGALWLAARGEGNPVRRGGRALAAGVSFVVPVLLALGFWRWVGQGEGGQGQGFFLNYLFGPSTWQAFDPGVWARHRRESWLNTLIPGWLFFVNSWEPEMNALDRPSPAVVRWFFQYWNTLPFGLGIIGLWTLCLRWGRVARAHPAVFALAGVAPFALFAVYWGAAATGLMREGLHPWVLSLLVLAAAGTTGTGARTPAPWLLAGRGVEVFAMCWLPTLLTSPLLPRPAYAWVDGAMLAMNLAALAMLTVLCFRAYSEAESV